MRRYTLLIQLMLLLFTGQFVFGQYQVSNTTVTDCTGTVSDANATGTFIFTIDIDKVDSMVIEVQVKSLKPTDSLKIYSGTTSGTLLHGYSNISVQANDAYSTAITSSGITTIVYHQQNSSGSTNDFLVRWTGILSNSRAITPISCYNETNGAIDMTLTETNFSKIAWTGDKTASTLDISSLSAGTYNLEVISKLGCKLNKTYVLPQPTPISVSTAIKDYNGYQTSCNTANDGEITLSASGGTGSYTYTLNSTNNADGKYINLGAGNYPYTVKDVNNCTFSSSSDLVINSPSALSVTTDTSEYGNYAIQCNGGSNGWITLNVSGGTAPYTYNWGGGVTTRDRYSLSAGTYNCTVTDKNNCSLPLSITLHQPSSLTYDTISLSHACYGEADGSVEIIAVGGDGTPALFDYKWGNGANTTANGSLLAGTYYFTITDNAGCKYSNSIAITQPTNPLAAIASVTQDKQCNGGTNDGAITVTPSGGYTASYSFDWSNSNSSQSQTNLAPGNYHCTVTDAQGCQVTSNTISITEPTAIAVTSAVKSYNGYGISCATATDGEVTLTASGGAGNYAYTFDGTNNTTGIFTNKASGSYAYTVKDDNNCTYNSVTDVTISAPTALVVDVDTSNFGGYNIQCNGGANGWIKLSVSGAKAPYSYSWSNGKTSSDIYNLSLGTYSCTITDLNGCSTPISVTLTQPAGLGFSTVSLQNACYGLADGNVSIIGTGGAGLPVNFTYSWNSGASGTNRTNLVAGTYFFTITDSAACQYSNSIAITQPSNPLAAIASITQNKLCNAGADNGQITVVPSGGYNASYTYSWNIPSSLQSPINLAPGNYSCIVSDAQGCQVTSNTVSITEPEAISVSLNAKDYNSYGVSCFNGNNGEVYLQATGGAGNYSYQWNAAAGSSTNDTIKTLVANVAYSVTVSDANSCTKSASITLTQPSIVALLSETKSDYMGRNVKCTGSNNGWIEVNGTGGVSPYTYLWDNNALNQSLNRATNLFAGTYGYSITDANNCQYTNSSSLIDAPLLTIDSVGGANVSSMGANDGALNINVINGAGTITYQWTGRNSITANQNQTNLYAGFYNVTVSDQLNCNTQRTFQISEPASLLGGTIAVNGKNIENVCDAVKPSPILQTNASSGGTESFAYTWQYSADNFNWAGNDFSASNSINYTIDSAIHQDWYIRRKVSDGVVEQYSNTILLKYIAPTPLAIVNLDTAYCLLDNMVTFQGIPANPDGTFIGNGISDLAQGKASFTPATAGEGTHSITYAYRDVYGCNDTISESVNIRPMPSPAFNIQSPLIRSNTPAHMTNITPHGGVFTGQGVVASDSIFIHETLELKSYTITYTVENEFGCIANTSRSVNLVEGAGSFQLTSNGQALDEIFCIDDDAFDIIAVPTYSYQSGLYNAGATNKSDKTGTITPSDLGAGTFTILFSYTTPDAKNYEIRKDITIYDIRNNAQILDLGSAYCDYNQIETIGAPSLNNEGTGVFSGNGIQNLTPGSALFVVHLAGATLENSPHKIQYDYTHTLSGCKAKDIKDVYVWTPTQPSFFTRDTFNVIEEAYTFSNINPSKGIFEGKAVSKNDSTFTPKNAGLGWHQISYAYSDLHSCKDTAKVMVYVDQAQGTFHGISNNNIYCAIGEPDTIWVTTLNGKSGGAFSGGAIENYGTDSAIINPTLFSSGEHTIKYDYIGLDGITQFSISTNIYVDDLGNLDFSLPEDKLEYCIDAASVQLKGLINGATATYGDFTGNNGIIQGVTNDGLASFSPANAGIGQHEVIFTVNSKYPQSTCSDHVSGNLIVNPLPVLQFPISSLYNSKSAIDTLKATPLGGKYTATGVSTDGLFNPAVPSLGQLSILYQYTNNNGCKNSISKQTLIQAPSGTFNDIKNLFCYTEVTASFSVIPDNSNGNPGRLFGRGVTDNKNNSGIYNPALAYDLNNTSIQKIKDTIFFEYTGINDTVKFTIIKVVELVNLGTVNFIGLNDERTYCKNHGNISLAATPSGGTFSAPNGLINATTFNPAVALLGSNPVTYSYTEQTSGCAISKVENLEILALPVVSFAADTMFCSNHQPSVIVGSPRDGVFTGSGISTLNSKQDSVQFTPAPTLLGDYQIKYEYTKPETGCTNFTTKTFHVDTIPAIAIADNFPLSYCINKAELTIQGVSKGVSLTSGFFSGNGVTDSNPNDGKATFIPTKAGVATHTITFTYTDINHCTNTYQQNIVVHNKPGVELSQTLPDYCKNSTPITISGSPSNVGTLTINGKTQAQTNIQLNFGAYADTNKIEFNYAYTDQNGCFNDTTKTIGLLEVPKVGFSISDPCIADSTRFYASSNFSEQLIDTYAWSFGENSESSALRNPVYKYSSPGVKNISLQITAKNTCVNKKDSSITFQQNPGANFYWENECIGQGKVSFKNLTTEHESYRYKWFFGDGEQSEDREPLHSYPSVGEYDAKLVVYSTTSSCSDTTQYQITIRPSNTFSTQPDYYQSFENGHGGWVPDYLSSENLSWALGKPNTITISKASDGEFAWVTNLNGNYNNNESSYLTSPCFDFTALKRPMISFDYECQTEQGRDGAVLQYTIDNGSTWENIGTINQGIEWFNSNDIISRPGDSPYGWTGANISSWRNARHDLQMVKQQKNVRFRIAFATDNNGIDEGFAIDNIYIGERKRRVLIEHFTNSTLNAANQANETINELIGKYPLDLIDIQYHTSYPQGDIFYMDYPAGANSRALFYSVSENPYTIMDGIASFDHNAFKLTQTNLMQEALSDYQMDMDMDTRIIGNSMEINIQLKSLKTIQNNQLVMHVVLVEKENVKTIGGETVVFQNVLRKMVPSPTGTILPTDWDPTHKENFKFTTDLGSYNKDNLIVIAFVQDKKLHNIMQTITNDTTSVSTGIKQYIKIHHDEILIYPNPAKKMAVVYYDRLETTSGKLEIINQQGMVVKILDVHLHSESLIINLQDLPSGVYVVKLKSGKGIAIQKMLIQN